MLVFQWTLLLLFCSVNADSRIKEFVSCEDTPELKISCSAGERIWLISGFYGRDDTVTCPTSNDPDVALSSCVVTASREWIKKECHGRNECTLRAANTMFEGSCLGVRKYLKIKYLCYSTDINRSKGDPLSLMNRYQYWHRKENMQHLVACENSDNVWAKCPPGEVIFVEDGFFGRDDTTTCVDVELPTLQTKCASPISIMKLRTLCHNKNFCLLEPLTSFFGDPCVGTPKYIKMSYFCRPAELSTNEASNDNFHLSNALIPAKQGTFGNYQLWHRHENIHEIIACENSEDVMAKCPAGKVIFVEDGFFGRNDDETCSGEGVPILSDECTTEDSYEKIKELCHNKNSCLLQPRTSVFGDPCTGTAKYIKMRYYCLPEQYCSIAEKVDGIPPKVKLKISEIRDILNSENYPPWRRESNKKHVVVCEGGEEVWAKCPAGLVIFVEDGFFGRDDTTTCTDVELPPLKSACTPQRSFMTLKELCHNKNSCLLRPHVSVFGDPCSGTGKYIKMDYYCRPQMITEYDVVEGDISIPINERKYPLWRRELTDYLDSPSKTITVCENTQDFWIKCPYGKKIWIEKGFYGRDDKLTCPHDMVKDSKCFAAGALQLLKLACNNKATCLIQASNTIYGDPCIGTFKYVKLSFICRTPEKIFPVKTIIACENATDAVTITCPLGKVIWVESGYFGRMDSVSCPHESAVTTKCSAAGSFLKLRALCHKRDKCVLRPSKVFFGEPCVGTHKYIKMDYSCRPQRFWMRRWSSERDVFNQIEDLNDMTKPSLQYPIHLQTDDEEFQEQALQEVHREKPVLMEGDKDIKELVICQDKDHLLKCPLGTKIIVVDGFYGRADAETCSNEATDNTSCRSPESLLKLKELCHNRNSCYLQASNDIFNDVCAETFKYLKITYYCSEII